MIYISHIFISYLECNYTVSNKFVDVFKNQLFFFETFKAYFCFIADYKTVNLITSLESFEKV